METFLKLITAFFALLTYALVANKLRFRRLKKRNSVFSKLYTDRASLAEMTNEDAHTMMKELQQFEFPFAFECSLAASLYRPYGIPSISRVLAKTKQFSTVCLASKRAADTAVLVVDFAQNPASSEKCCAAISRMNYVHSHYQRSGLIQNDDLLYTLALLAWLPIRFIERFEWRGLTEIEQCAVGVFWKSLGDSMNISFEGLTSAPRGDGLTPRSKSTWRDGLHFLEELHEWSEQYECKFMVPSALNHKAATETEAVLLYGIPNPLKRLGRHALSALMDERLRCALMLPNPPRIVEIVMFSTLQLRKFILRYLCLPRFKPHLRVTQKPDANGRYHRITWAAQPWYVKSSFSKRWRWQAWKEWIAGRPLPGDDCVAPLGYTAENIGPAKFEGKGRKEWKVGKERLMKNRGGCPFGG